MNTRPFQDPRRSSEFNLVSRVKTRGMVVAWMGLMGLGLVGCSEKKESVAPDGAVAAPSPATAASPSAVAAPETDPTAITGYVPLNADAEDGLWTNLRAVQETTPSGGLTFRVQAVEGSGVRAALGKDLADKLKKAGFESMFETIKSEDAKQGLSAVVKCHFTRTPITEKVFSAIGRFYIEGQFEMRSDDDLPKQEIVLTLYGNPSFSESGRVSFK